MLLIPFLVKDASSVEYCTKIVDLDCVDEEAIDKKWSVVANQLIEESEHAGHDRDAKGDQVKCSTQCDGFLAIFRQNVPWFSSIMRKIFFSNTVVLTSRGLQQLTKFGLTVRSHVSVDNFAKLFYLAVGDSEAAWYKHAAFEALPFAQSYIKWISISEFV